MTDIADAQNPLAGVLSADQIDALVNAAEDLGEGRHGVEELLSRMTTQTFVNRARAAGFSEHLTKPINFERLEESIQNLLEPEPAVESEQPV